ncbi:MAG: polyphosphate kinase 1 [Sedimentisphaerales bacterium]|nr:polyphosphate kinase 1 [Sedimentisphaerales bacterium]
MKKKGDKSYKSTNLFINRELSWLEFNDRVLQEGLNPEVPLLERLKFLSIVSSNLDEFFMVRVAGLTQQRDAGIRTRDISGLTPSQLLKSIHHRVSRMVNEQAAGIKSILKQLVKFGIHVPETPQWTMDQKKFLRSFFTSEILPVLTPVAIQELDPPPLLPGLQLFLAVLLTPKETEKETSGKNKTSVERIMVVPVPTQFSRFVTIPTDKEVELARLEDVMAGNIDRLFPQHKIQAVNVFRITRDADMAVQDDDVGDLLATMEKAVLDRRRRRPLRLVISAHPNRKIKSFLVDWLQLRSEEVYEIDGMLDATSLMEIVTRPGSEEIKDPDWPPQPARDLIGQDDLWQAIQDHDIMLFHPYESFDPVIHLVTLAAEDPDVLAIKQTLYRTSGDSPIIKALEQAAQSGKQVNVLVELKARFDEARNVQWARRLEDAGCLVIYGIAGYKTHSKALLIVRREAGRIRRYVHLATGNYNDKTARLYTDMGLITCDNKIATDVAAFFNLLTGYSEVVGWSELTIAPTDLRRRFIELIEREIQSSTQDNPGLIMAKVNSLQDKQIIQALYRASKAGVKIMLNIRGICSLRPGVKKVSENIEVVSIIDRFLEHPRIFYFRNAGHEELYLSSADWMTRNLDKRLEILFPIKDPAHRRRALGILQTYFNDNQKSRRLLPDGTYKKITDKKKPLRAQELFFHEALDATRTSKKSTVRFKPLRKPK